MKAIIILGCRVKKVYISKEIPHFHVIHSNLNNLPGGVVGGTSSTTIFDVLILFSIATSLGCFWSIVFIGTGFMFFNFLAASYNSSLLELRYSWKISSTYSVRANMFARLVQLLTNTFVSIHSKTFLPLLALVQLPNTDKKHTQ